MYAYTQKCKNQTQTDLNLSPVLQLGLSVSMGSENDVLMKEYIKMMTDMIVLCATLALSLFFWVISLAISTYYGELPVWKSFFLFHLKLYISILKMPFYRYILSSMKSLNSNSKNVRFKKRSQPKSYALLRILPKIFGLHAHFV